MNDWHENAPVEHRVTAFTNGINHKVAQLRATLVGETVKIYRGKYARHNAIVDDVNVNLVDGELMVLCTLKIKRKSHPGFINDKKYPRWQKHEYIFGVEIK